MAVLAAQDWQLPRDHTMDLSSANSVNQSSTHQRSSPANDNSPSSTPPPQQTQHQQSSQPYPYPVQQQPQGGWTPSIAAQPFYPSFYQNPHQQPFQLQGHPGHAPQSSMGQQTPYFDPAANAQIAQWAYQQMMFNAQQAQLHISHVPGQRNGPDASAGYFPQSQIPPAFSPFPTSTPQHQFGGGQRGDQQQYGGFHPYKRPNKQPSRSQDDSWRAGGPPQPPYARPDASGSSSSLNSGSSHGSRPRTNSNQSGHSANGHTPASHSHSNNPPSSVRSRNGPSQATQSNGRTSSPNPSTSKPQHLRNQSSSSSNSSVSVRPSVPAAVTTTAQARPSRPSPLSQGNFTAREKRMSRDDSDLAAMRDPTPSAAMVRSGGLKSRLRRALSFNAQQTLQEDDDDDVSIKASSSKPSLTSKSSTASGPSTPTTPTLDDTDDAESTATIQMKKKSRAAALFNSRMNLSTDNISLSSTVSSASVMIRKLGSMGKLARRNSLAGITSLFKDKKDKDGDGEGDASGGGGKKDKKKKKGGKGEASEASVSHVTAELDRTSSGDWTVGPEMSGLSPAAKLARQHTLKSNAEAAARAKQREADAIAERQKPVNGVTVPGPWEKNTTTRQGSPVKGRGGIRVTEDGTRVLVEDDDSASDEGSMDGQNGARDGGNGWDDDDWGDDDDEEDEDVTIRVGFERTNIADDGDDIEERWGIEVRRSVEKARKPSKGILKYSGSYDQHSHLTEPNPIFSGTRGRSNSYNSHPGQTSELGPLARIPSPDPDHIDGLSRHPSHSSNHSHPQSHSSTTPVLPPLSFDLSDSMPVGSSKDLPGYNSLAPHPPQKSSSIFNHPNSSAPALSMFSSDKAPTLTHRSATVPAKKTLAFASNLSVYDTFSSSVYDRRSEPATWSRLTPALAQRIKEELNSYKMEEMEVHAASRIHTQFFV